MNCLSVPMCAQAEFCFFNIVSPKRDYSPRSSPFLERAGVRQETRFLHIEFLQQTVSV